MGKSIFSLDAKRPRGDMPRHLIESGGGTGPTKPRQPPESAKAPTGTRCQIQPGGCASRRGKR
jgi:hypothetical protein